MTTSPCSTGKPDRTSEELELTHASRATLANLISTVSSVVASAYAPSDSEGIFTPTQSPRARFYEKLDDGMLWVPSNPIKVLRLIFRSFHIGDSDTALLHVAAVMDPVSEQAQMWSALLKVSSVPTDWAYHTALCRASSR
jgi:UDP-glucose:glycoprotein glucosyltransferase